jgi:hypothetical protein
MIKPDTLCLIVQGPFTLKSWGERTDLLGRTCVTRGPQTWHLAVCGFDCYPVDILGEPITLLAAACLVPLVPPPQPESTPARRDEPVTA